MTKILKAAPAVATQPVAGRKLGYGRVSTETQSEAQQHEALVAAGCSQVFTETISSGKADRPQLAAVMAELQAGDTLVICKLDRMARSLRELLTIAAELEARGCHLQVLDQKIDTGSPAGKLTFHLLGAIAEFERGMAIERTRASVEHRRAIGGDLGGRRPSYTPQQQELALRLRSEGHSISQVAKALGVSKGTAHRMVSQAQGGA